MLCRTFLGFSLLQLGKKQKVLCYLHSLSLLESCMRNISHTRRRWAEFGLEMTLLCPGAALLQEGRIRALPDPPGSQVCRGGAGIWVPVGATTTLRLFSFRTGRNHCGQGLPSQVKPLQRFGVDGWTDPAWLLLLWVFLHGVFCVPLRSEAAAPNSESPSAQQGLLFQKGQPWV